MLREIMEWVKTIAISVAIALIITSFVKPSLVSGESMNPTLDNLDFIVLENTKDIERGDIIVFESHLEWVLGLHKSLIKRAIAVEGDQLIIKEGKVFVNNQQLTESYIAESYTTGDIKIEKVPKNKVFVMGDNRNNSLDSRSEMIGLIDLDDIKGKILIRLFPVSKFGVVE